MACLEYDDCKWRFGCDNPDPVAGPIERLPNGERWPPNYDGKPYQMPYSDIQVAKMDIQTGESSTVTVDAKRASNVFYEYWNRLYEKSKTQSERWLGNNAQWLLRLERDGNVHFRDRARE